MKHHIIRVIAVVTAVLMLLSIVPAAALQELSLPNLMSAVTDTEKDSTAQDGNASENAEPTDKTTQETEDATDVEEPVVGDAIVDDEDYDFADDVVLGKDYSEFVGPTLLSDGAKAASDLEANGMINKTLSPYEPYKTELEEHPFLPYGTAWIDLSSIYYGAPATQNYPLTKWSANTSVYNITETGKVYASGKSAGEKEFLFRDVDLIDGYTWAGHAADPRLNFPMMDENGNFVTDPANNNAMVYTGITEHGVVSSETTYRGDAKFLTAKNGNVAYAYNRYDAMQGKYGITFDRNVKSAVWDPTWVDNYFEDTSDLYQSVVYLSDTPYLYFSTEAPDTTKIAISLLIGSPVQKEVGSNTTSDQTYVTNTTEYEYRWYTITDNADRPGISLDSRDYSMIPNITVSDVVATVAGETGDKTNAFNQQTNAVISAVTTAGKTDPLALAAAKDIDTDTMYVDGAITGCLDFTNILPVIMGQDPDKDHNDGGREDVQYKVAQIRVDTKTAENADDSAFRLNYLYFGPSLVTVFSPQNTVGADVDAQSWQYAQGSADSVGKEDGVTGDKLGTADVTTERGYTSGWENGAAVSFENTPNNPQLLTVDIYGKGDGQLIEWSAVPASANIKRGSSDSKVWKFTDNNGVVQYMEAEFNTVGHSGIDDSYYVMVTVPVRKWVHVLGESRKISLNATLLHEGTQFPDAHLKPTFVLWGNEDGSLGCGHSGSGFGTRFRNEDLIMVFATDGQTYHCDQGQDYVAAEVDRTIGDSLMYNAEGGTNESWFDMLRSPYTYQETVTDSNRAVTTKLTDNHIGYTFVTSLRFAMPIGSAISVQNMKGDGNSAGLNTYSATGSIVSAYDGGTGIQPEINVSNTLPEKNVTITKTGTGNTPADYTYTQGTEGDGTIKGTISTGAAAYGPMLEQSFYTIYDLLDTEQIRAASKDSHYSTNAGKNKQLVYGQNWIAKEDLPIRHAPDDTEGVIYGYAYGGCQFVIYSSVILTDKNRTKWGLVGVLTKNGSTEIGWVKMWDGVTNTTYVNKVSGVPYSENVETTYAKANSYGRSVVKALKNDWILSEFSSIDNNADFRDGTNTTFEYTSDFRNNSTNAALNSALGGTHQYHPAQNMVSQSYGGPQLKYANKWMGAIGHYACGYSMQDFYLRAINGTDLEWGFKRNVQTTNNISMGMTRVFDNPIRLKQGKSHIHQSYPVLYLDYTADTEFKIGLNLRVDGDDKIWYVYGTNNGLQYIAPDDHAVPSGNRYGYLSFEDLMTVDYKDASTIEVTGISLYMWNGTSVSEGNVVLRRCEIWQEETDWLDEIIADNQYSGGNSSTAMNCQVRDSMNIINDAYFHHHDETADGEYTITKKGDYASGTNIGINNANKGYEYNYTDGTQSKAMDYWENGVHYQYTRTESYRKNNSNKGWRSYIRLDTTKDGKVDSNDTTYYAYQAPSVDGVYDYRTALGHLRVWVPSQTQASVVFESDRSFNTKNYKYLYYSYSMRDMDTGISAEEPDTARDDGLEPGIAVSIKQSQLGSSNAYSEIVTGDGTRTWAYYDSENAYWAEDGRDNRTFKTTINAALDLSTLDGIESVNQFVFYLDNPMGTLGDGKSAEFYINYLYLSNVPPSTLISNEINKTQKQYYYMMDNTGDRYSARFPTLDNPTGQVSGLNADNDRVNPIIIDRGARLSDGVYFNGDPIYTYGKDANGNVITGSRDEFDDQSASKGYYEKTYGTTDGITGSMKNILFYAGVSQDEDDLNDIQDYYDYKAADGSVGDIYDMKWSYGRWDLGAGESGLNTMYIGDPDNLGTNDTANAVSGNLTRRYATENYVLLRAGITPKKYLTYFDAKGGQIKYSTSSEEMQTGVIQNLNNYYIDENVVFSYFKTPRINAMDESKNMPTKYGYVFDGWYRDDDASGDAATSANRLFKYTKKDEPNLNYFFASWKPAYELSSTDPRYEEFYLPEDTEYTVTFKHPEDGAVWYTRPANYETEFQMLMPTLTRVKVDGKQMHVIGWQVEGVDDGPVYAPGSSVTITETVTLVAVTQDILESEDSSKFTHTVTVPSTVELKLFRDQTDADGKPVYGDPASLEIKSTEANGTITYYNIPHSVVLVAVPTTAKSGYGWTMSVEADGNATGVAATAVCGVSEDAYKFSALSDVRLNYVNLSGILDQDSAVNGAAGTAASAAPVIFTTAAETTVNPKNMVGREMKFYTQFNVDHIANATVVAYGTLYTKSGANYDSIADALNAEMRLDEATITATTIENGAFGTKTTAVRQVKATEDAANSSNQYYLMVTENKGNAVTYYARGYVIYQIDGGAYQVAYSDTVARSEVPAATLSVEGV